MAIVETLILIVTAVVVADIVNLILPRLPLAVLQVAAGLALSLLPNFNYTLEPKLFMIAIIAPLMFNDGQNESLTAVTHNYRQILSLSVVLVLVTVGLAGVITARLWTALSLPLAFMLVAIITPTDAVAVSSVTARVKMPGAVMGALDRESLFNDASGLVVFNLAITALLSGKFSVDGGIMTFLVTFLGGIILGWLIGLVLVSLRMYLTRMHADISAIIIPVNVMTPILVYALAERVGVSGILAVVAAGLAHGMYRTHLQLTSTKLRIVSDTVWAILAEILNGFVFVLLGATLPSVLNSISLSMIGLLITASLILYIIIFMVRFLWIRLHLATINNDGQPTSKAALLFALGGVHGTITLAMAFSIPVTLFAKGSNLRSQLIFVAAAVILISILVTSVVYPLLLPRKIESFTNEDVNRATKEMIYYALDQLHLNHGTTKEVEQVTQVIGSQVGVASRTSRADYTKLMNKVQDVGLKHLAALAETGQIDNDVYELYRRFVRNVSVESGSPRELFGALFRDRKHRRRNDRATTKRPKKPTAYGRASQEQLQHDLIEALRRSNDAATDYLNEIQTPDNVTLVSLVKRTLAQQLQRFKQNTDVDEDEVANLIVEVFQYEHTYVQEQVAGGKINRALANAMNEQISTDQLVYMQSGI